MRKLARFCISHCVLVVAGWIVLLLVATAVSRVTGNAYSNSSFNLAGTGPVEGLSAHPASDNLTIGGVSACF